MKNILRKLSFLFLTLGLKGFFNWMSDELYLHIAYRLKMQKQLNLNNPVTFSEKIQYLKIHDRKPIYTLLADKYEVKRIIANIIGDQFIIPTIGIWDRFEDIDFLKLPNQFVLKCTHDSGSTIICYDKLKFDFDLARRKIKYRLSCNYYLRTREFVYKYIKPRVIAENLLIPCIQGEGVRDYKFYCFNGKVKMILIVSERSRENTYMDFYDINFNHLNLRWGHPNAKILPKKPKHFQEMIFLSEKISHRMIFTRIDFYDINDKIFFGEITFYPTGGLEPFEPAEWDKIIGEWITLY